MKIQKMTKTHAKKSFKLFKALDNFSLKDERTCIFYNTTIIPCLRKS